ncbi:MAG: winged helix-turn-helix transcriptional regulator, partial [Candidatus Nitrosocosmicus sp.]
MNKTNTFEYNTNNKNDNNNLFDEIDLKLLDLFLKNENSKKTAEKSKIPLSTVRRRTKNLLKKGLANQKT